MILVIICVIVYHSAGIPHPARLVFVTRFFLFLSLVRYKIAMPVLCLPAGAAYIWDILMDMHTVDLQPGLAVGIASSSPALNTQPQSFHGDAEFLHFNCQLQGEFDIQVGRQHWQLAAGAVNIGFAAGEKVRIDRCAQLLNVAVMVNRQLLPALVGDDIASDDLVNTPHFFIHTGRASQQTTASATQIVQLMRENAQHKLLLHASALEFLHWHLHACSQCDQRHGVSSRERKQLEMAREFLLSDLSLPPTIFDLAGQVGLNQCKLKFGFKKLFGSSIYAYFQQERMKEARRLLAKYSVTDTAVQLGYSNISHFSVAFRKQFGILPSEVRKEWQICHL